MRVRNACLAAAAAASTTLGAETAVARDPAPAEAVRAADRALARLACVDKNLGAFVSSWEPSGSMMMANAPVATGAQALRAAFAPFFALPGFHCEWEPTSVEVARSGDLAYSTGAYTNGYTDPQGRAVVDHGSYVTVWRKDAGGQWRVAFDTLASALPAAPGREPLTPAERNKAAKRRYVEAFNRRDVAAFGDLFAPEYVLHATGYPEIRGPEELRKAVAASLDALSDVRLTADEMVAEGDRVATRWTMRARHTGTFMGVSATGRKLSFSGTLIDRFVDGKVVEGWETIDMLGLRRQLGTIPAAEGGAAAGPKASEAKEVLAQYRTGLDAFVAASSQEACVASYLDLHTDDAVLMLQGMPAVCGREAIREFIADFCQKYRFEFRPWESDELTVREDVAVHRLHGMAILLPRAGGEATYRDSKYLDVLRRGRDGRWRVAIHIFNTNQ
jgi:steroid delta-isomerase-like uncharacterized protein/uncharacterized protein (TIGR02246 family)